MNATAGPSFANDLTTGLDGTVYLSDSRANRILVLRPGAQAFETLSVTTPLSSPNGVTISEDGHHLLVSDLDHVRVVSLADGRDWRLAVPDSINMAGIDGLAFFENALIAHHPLAFWRIVRYEVEGALQRVLRAEYIERNSPDPRTSTARPGGARRGGDSSSRTISPREPGALQYDEPNAGEGLAVPPTRSRFVDPTLTPTRS